MNRPVLLDVNVLIALFDRDYLQHETAHRWFAQIRARGWRTCPISENGFLRILSNPNYVNGPYQIASLSKSLEHSKKATDYTFWPDSFSLSEWMEHSGRTFASSKTTDAYLLQLAAKGGGAFGTFDLRVNPGLIGSTDETLIEYVR